MFGASLYVCLIVGSVLRGRLLKIALHFTLTFAMAILFSPSFLPSGLSICLSQNVTILSLSTNLVNVSSIPCFIFVKL